MEMTPQHLWESMGIPAKMVFFTLLVMLIGSVYVLVERGLLYMKARGQSRAVGGAIAGPLKAWDLDAALKVAGQPGYKASYLAAMLRAGLAELSLRGDKYGVEAVKRAVEKTMLEESARLRTGMNILATVGSTAPFVGLVGTIFGIINAFAVMASVGGGDLTAISGGIAEALVTTAVGIAVAIVGIWIYNFFNAVLDDITKDMQTASQELVDWSEKYSLRQAESRAAK